MKYFLSIIGILVSCLACSDYEAPLEAPLEGRVLNRVALDYLESTARDMELEVERKGHHRSSSQQGHAAESHAQYSWGYSIWFTSEEDLGYDLMAKYRDFLISSLETSGAKFLDQELAGDLESLTSFKLLYSKSKVSGNVSATYQVGTNGRHLFEVSQSEDQ